MRVLFRSHRLLATGAAVALAASFLVAGGSPAGAVTHPPLTVSKTIAHSGLDHGDSITESGGSCTDESATSVTMWLARGVVADDQPINTDLTPFGFAALPDAEGNWTGDMTISGGSPDFVLPPGQYTLRTECDAGPSIVFIYAGVVITITDGDTTTTTAAPTTTADPGSTTTTAAGATTTTAAPVTTAAPAAAVAAQATFTG